MLLSRQFCMELNGLAVKLQAECKPETCTQVAILKTIMTLSMFCKRIQLQDEENLKINSKLSRQSALDDSNGAVDILVCSSQNAQGVSGNRWDCTLTSLM